MATRFHDKVFTFTQPDGTKIQLKGSGDQNYAVFETLDGYTVTKNPVSRYWEVARVSPDGNALLPAGRPADARLDGSGLQRGVRVNREAALAAGRASALATQGRRCDQRREEKRQQAAALRTAAAAGGPMLAPPSRATVGDYVGLCLLVDFSDEQKTITREEVEKFCNLPGYSGFGNRGSVRDFFLENSIQRCDYSNIVAPYYRAAHPKSYYTDPNIDQPIRAIELINEALASLKANGFDFSRLTVDSQGFVYAMNVYYAGRVTNNWAEGLWPHAFHLGSAVLVGPGRRVYDYQFTAMGSELELGTFCHENGHMLCDYPDLYDYGDESSGVGGFCLMCAGNNVNEKNPIQVSAYLKRLSGWANSVTAIEHGQTVSLKSGTNDFAIHSRGGREYFLIENRNKSGRDASLPDQGLAIWHVDESGNNSHEAMTGSSHYELSLEQADGQFELEKKRGEYGDVNDLYSGANATFSDVSVPNSKWWDGTASNLTIDQVSPIGTTMTFRARLSSEVTPATVLTASSTPNKPIPDNNSTGITDTVQIAQSASISTVKIKVDISHTYRGDLRVTLLTPWGATIELLPKGSGGSADHVRTTFDESIVPALATLKGKNAQGSWRLGVQDLANADVGTLNAWSVEIATTQAVAGPIEHDESPGTLIPDDSSGGIERAFTTTSAIRVRDIEVFVDITHPWVGDLQVSLLSPAGASVILQNRVGGSDDNLVRTFTAANTPALAVFVSQPVAGTWKLRVADLARQDIGKLNRWRLKIAP